MIDYKVKFLNQLYIPLKELSRVYATDPLALDPESNLLLHQFEGLVLHTNHFNERNRIPRVGLKDSFRDMANSIKHLRKKNNVKLSFQIIYEWQDDKFRFMRNSVIGEYNDGTRFDAVSSLCSAVNTYIHILSLDLPLIQLSESNYEFYECAFSYLLSRLSVSTTGNRIQMVKRSGTDYEAYDPKEVRYIVLAESALGQDPRPYFRSLVS